MPGNVRFDWHARVSAVEREYAVVRAAADRLAEAVATARVLLHPYRPSHLRDAIDNLDGTYLVRLFAVFEAALRSYWMVEVRESRPPAEVLVDRVADRVHIPRSEVDDVHAVRLRRNGIVHEDAGPASEVTLNEARGGLQTFLKRLPDRW